MFPLLVESWRKFKFGDMVSRVQYVGLNTEEDARSILRMFQEAN